MVTPKMERNVTSVHMTAVTSPVFRRPSTKAIKNGLVHNMSELVLWLIDQEENY